LAFVAREKTFQKGDRIALDIEDLAVGGKGIAKATTPLGPFAVFVQNAFPGQRVQGRVVISQQRFAECQLERVLERAPFEVETGFQSIPGAPYATVPVDIQRTYKERITLDLFTRFGEVPDVAAVYGGWIASPEQWHYRNKMEYSFSAIVHDLETDEQRDGFGLGFKHRGTWWAVENLDGDSGLFDAAVESEMHRVRGWCEGTGLPAWHPPRRTGFYRFLVVRKSFAEDKLLVQLVTTSAGLDRFDLPGFVDCVRGLWGDRVAGVIHTVNDDTGERVEARDGQHRPVWGSDHIVERLGGLSFSIQMGSFFQTNPRSAERLYAEVVAQAMAPAAWERRKWWMDLFCGTGTIAQLLAQASGQPVIGVDIVADAIADAQKSAAANGVSGIAFHAADVGKFLLEFPQYAGSIDTIVLDPPRAGIAPKTLRKIIRLEAPRLVYVSCNPATQARDFATLQAHGYRLASLKLVDQFPHTSHVESVARLDRVF
jgi:23S rRNA (uracil-5-)-methyltransferase RumA